MNALETAKKNLQKFKTEMAVKHGYGWESRSILTPWEFAELLRLEKHAQEHLIP